MHPTETAVAAAPGRLDGLPWVERATVDLPADPDTGVRARPVLGACFTRVRPTPVAAPVTLAWSAEVADLLGLSADDVASPDFAQVMSGNRVPAGTDPWAACYGGHQFGNWAGQLGDGRAIVLGELLDRTGRPQVLQLKGAGPTPYSRGADGRAVLRSSIREFVCSEAMHHLGVPTTRALSLVATGDAVVRDVLYDGHPAPEPGAVVCRVAPSFTRFGSFELPASRDELDVLRALVRTTIRDHFPHLAATVADPLDALAPWFAEVCERTAALVVDWMRVGFVHGVLNTDNMSILGLTVDYGPYGWLEGFDPGWTPNTTDAGTRRYRFGAQPRVAQWNLLQLGNALVQLTGDAGPLEEGLTRYGERYVALSTATTAARLGWGAWREGDDALVEELFDVLGRTETDFVLFHRDLARVPVDPTGALDDDALLAPLADAWYAPAEVAGEVRAAWVGWLRRWGARVVDGGVADGERRQRMDALNPRFVPRNWLAQEAIDRAEEGDPDGVRELAAVLEHPYDEQPGRERYARRRPEWARSRVGCSMLSCSS